jgi:hypothetical protein
MVAFVALGFAGKVCVWRAGASWVGVDEANAVDWIGRGKEGSVVKVGVILGTVSVPGALHAQSRNRNVNK